MAQITSRKTAAGRTRYDVRTRVGGRVVTKTFSRRRDADAYAATIEADKLRGVVVDPRRARVTVEDWCRSWLSQRSDLRPATRRLYAYLLRDHVFPAMGATELGKLSPSAIRAWHATLLSRHPAVASRSYQVLRASLNTAVSDGVLAVNPCKVKGAGQGSSKERPVAAIAEIDALADAIEVRWRAMVLLAYWCSLRLGELRGLRRRDVDLLHSWVQVREQVVDVGGRLLLGPPKTEAGRRRVAIPPHLRADLEHHLATFVDPDADAFLFTGHHGAAPLPSVTWRRAWAEARRATDSTHLHFHDLRHAGNTLAAATGASTRELMARMGHASPRAALIYQHATSDRDQAIAAALSEIATQRSELRDLSQAHAAR
ncbi:MAG TPA: tyrosine-type recombinase/integrase [Acidimicrobiales bacterium]|nr:tyrosine-type recombinase/integrase [Acidimicrobiales bacterium]